VSHPRIDVDVRPETRLFLAYGGSGDELWRVVVTIGGRSWFANYAGDRPSESKVRADYLADKGTNRSRNWIPFYSTG
jgi:hypothetical protein